MSKLIDLSCLKEGWPWYICCNIDFIGMKCPFQFKEEALGLLFVVCLLLIWREEKCFFFLEGMGWEFFMIICGQATNSIL